MSLIIFSLCFGAALASYGVPAAPPAFVRPIYQPPQVIVRDPGAIFVDNSWDSHERRHDCGRLDVWKACKRDDECSVPKLRVFERSHNSIHGFMHCEGSDNEIVTLINEENEGDVFAYGQAEVGKLVKCRRGRWSARNLDGEWTKIKKVSCQVTIPTITTTTVTGRQAVTKQPVLGPRFVPNVVVANEATTEKVITEKITTVKAAIENVTTQETATENITTQKDATENVTTQEAATENVTTQEAATENVTTQEAATEGPKTTGAPQ